MNLLKSAVKTMLCWRPVAAMAIDLTLRIHGASYRLAGLISQSLEGDRLHPKHRLMDFHSWFASKLRPDWTILDVGCGNGALASDLLPHCRRIVAIDINPQSIKEARKRNPDKNIEFIVGDATAYPFREHFNAVILSNVLEHLEPRVQFLRDMARHCDIFLIRVPMMDRDWITEYKRERGLSFKLDPSHIVEYTLDSFSHEISGAGLSISEHRVRFGELYAVCHRSS